jgi:hypothetical protein
MSRQVRPPKGGGYVPAGPPIDMISEEEKAGMPLPPLARFVTPHIDERLLELLRQLEAEAAARTAPPSPPAT